MRQKLFTKYFFATAVTVLLSLTVMFMILTFVYNDYLTKTKYETLQKSCEAVYELIGERKKDSNNGISDNHIYYVINNLSKVSDIDIFVTDNDGIIKICTCKEFGENGACEHSGAQIDVDDVNRFASGKDRNYTTLGIYSQLHYVSAISLKSDDGTPVGFAVATYPVTAIRSLMLRIARLYVLSAVIPIIIMFIVLYAINYRLTRPLKLMSQAARAMAKGDFSRRIPVTSDDEIGELAVSFNQMTNSLARLEETRKNFIANISHELKTPMTTISGFIDGIIDGTIEPDKQSYYLSIVSDEVKRLSRMVQSMLSLSRLESGEFTLHIERFDFKELLLNVVIGQEQRIEGKNLSIEGLDVIPDITVSADRDLIYRVVYNLVDNAIKFTNDKGLIKFSLKTDSKKLNFTITNTGRGIPENELAHVFDRFYKVDKSRSDNKNSTGLGLYMVKTIIKNHGGSVAVSSKENEFTSFEVILPLSN